MRNAKLGSHLKNISKKNHSNAVQWFSFALGVYFIYRSDWRRSFLTLKKCEILQIVFLSIFNREKWQLPYLLD